MRLVLNIFWLSIISTHALAEVPDTVWNRIVAEALSGPHTMEERCSKGVCTNTIRFTKEGVRYRLTRRAVPGQEKLIFCKAEKCEEVH